MGSEARTRLALVVLLLVTLFSFGQVFDRGDWPGPPLLGIGVALVIAVVARRLGLGTFLTVLASAVALVWYLAFIFRLHDLYFGLPTPDALRGILRSISSSYAKSNVDYAPVPVRTGYVVLAVIGMWSAATLAEIATFRWRRPLVATLPLIALFSLLTVVGTRTGTTFVVLAFLTSLLSYLALESSHRLRSWGAWITSLQDRNAETPGEVSSRLARRMGASCLAAALFSPVFLPAIGDGLLSWRSANGVGSGTGTGIGNGQVDLLASLQPQIIEQSQADMFFVDSDQADYWRLTSLVSFDGTTWTPLEEQPREPLLPGGRVVSAHLPRGSETLTQSVEIAGLGGEFMPAAGQPTTVTITNEVGGRDVVDVTSQQETGAIQLRGGVSEGVGYEVTSLVPRPSFKDLRDASIGAAQPIYLDEGPVPISSAVENLIQRWTGSFDTPFKKLLALQDNLQQFTYSIDVPATASTDHLSEFLLVSRRGYCQQFAAAFALIARHLGFPTRISIGFLPGSVDVAQPDHYVVKGTDAHAWPEVLFEDHGWVRFEPTPGNNAAPPSYTSRATPFQAQNPFSDTGGGRNGLNPQALAGNQGDVPVGGRDRGAPVDTGGASGDGGRAAWEETFSRAITILLLALLVFIASVPLLKTFKSSARYRTARTPSKIAEAAFAHFQAEAADLAASRAPSESASAFARRMASSFQVPRSSALELAAIYERATYGRDPIDKGSAIRARRLAAALRNELWTNASLWRRVKRLFSPAGLMPR